MIKKNSYNNFFSSLFIVFFMSHEYKSDICSNSMNIKK